MFALFLAVPGFFLWYNEEKKEPTYKFTFVGTGTSNGIPQVSCLTKNKQKSSTFCEVCEDSMKKGSKNRRRNTSLLIQFQNQDEEKNILFDCGKYFHHSALEHFPSLGLKGIDHIILTHDHFDACGGLDDLRDFSNNKHIDIHLRERDFKAISNLFPYLVDSSNATGSGYVSNLKFNTFKGDSLINVEGIDIQVFEVEHGKDYQCCAFKFENIVYMSDVSSIPKDVEKYLEGLDLLIIDCLALTSKTAVKNITKVRNSTFMFRVTSSFQIHLKQFENSNLKSPT